MVVPAVQAISCALRRWAWGMGLTSFSGVYESVRGLRKSIISKIWKENYRIKIYKHIIKFLQSLTSCQVC